MQEINNNPLCSICGTPFDHVLDDKFTLGVFEYLVCSNSKCRWYGESHFDLSTGCPVCFSRQMLISNFGFCCNVDCPAYLIENYRNLYYKLYHTNHNLVFFTEKDKWQIQEDYVVTIIDNKSYPALFGLLNSVLNRHLELGKVKCLK